ncbi:MAG TPA: hypothetical protein VFE85_03795, partial [Woeseiaceae bacterium]|nr:hypothetical protein [Woeseiaceae bacterium]
MCAAGSNDRVEVFVRAGLPSRDAPGVRASSAAPPGCPVLKGVELLETRMLPATRRIQYRF